MPIGSMEKKLAYTLSFLMVFVNGSHQMCLDVHDTMTVCVGNKFIKGIPEKIDTNLTKICFMHGENTDVPKNAFILLTRMESIYLNLTNIFTISEGAFNRLYNLTTLGFYGNRISKLEKPIFLPLIKVTTLDLSGNDISKISDINFFGLQSLENLLIVHNYIKTVRREDFDMVPKLKHLDLSLNYIENIENQTFSDLNELEILNLNYNKINSLDDGVFDGLIKLHTLKLRGNYLECVPTQNINPRVSLVIDFRDNNGDCEELKSEISAKNTTIQC